MTLAAVVVCGLAVTLFTQCNKDKNKKPEVTMAYCVSVSPDVLNVADVEINYLDRLHLAETDNDQHPASHRRRLGQAHPKGFHRRRQLSTAHPNRRRHRCYPVGRHKSV